MTRYFFFILILAVSFIGNAAIASHSYDVTCTFSGDPTVNKVIKGVPSDLDKFTLLVPRYDLIEPNEAMPPARRKNMMAANQMVKEGNTTLNKTLKKNYDGEYEMVSLKKIEYHKAQGHKYFLDLVIMPKQMTEPKKEAMVACFRKYNSANRMYTNYNQQFHYYFYIRDLETDDAYITTAFKGNREVYKGIAKFLKQVNSDSQN